MVTFISRDYSPLNANYIAQPFGGSWGANQNRFYVPIIYHLSLFLTKILGFTNVGQTSWNIDNTNVKSLPIATATFTTPIVVTTPLAHGLIDGYVVNISGATGNTGANGSWKVIVLSPTQFTLYGSYGTGAYNANSGTMTSGFQYAAGSVADGYAASINFGAGFIYEVAIPVARKQVSATDVGKTLVLKSPNFPTKNSGIFKISAVNLGNTTTVTAASNGAALPQATINVVSTTGFPTSGTINIATGTTIAALSNGVSLPTATINVASTSGFPTSGIIFVVTSTGLNTVVYTNTTATSFTGCTGGTGAMTTGGSVTNSNPIQTISYTNTTATSFTGCTGGVGTLATGAPVSNLNRYVIDYRSTDTPPAESNALNWWLYEIETVVSGYMVKFAQNDTAGGLGVGSSSNTFNTTIAVASNGQSLPQSTINVASTTSFPNPGVINVTTSNGPQIVNYTGVTATTFTGCSGGTGTMSTGGAVNNPIIIQTNSNFPHTWVTGQQVTIAGHATNTNANGTWTITQAGSTTFALNGSVGTAAAGATGTAVLFGYLGGASVAANSRAIYQSPHPSGWQIRLCAEPEITNLPRISAAVGYGGTSIGEFPILSATTNIVEYLNFNPSVNTSYNNTIPGLGTDSTASRMTIMGESSGQSIFMYTRTLGATNNGMLTFGISDNEPVPTPSNLERLFLYGGAPTTDSGTIILRTGSTLNIGNCIKNGLPELSALTGWANLDGTSATSPLLSANAGDSPFTGTTELLPIETWAAPLADVALALPGIGNAFSVDHKFMGTAPFLRNGRTNFATFSLSSEETTTRTITAATNVTPIQITTGLTNALVTGQTVTISGVLGNTAANGTWVITVINGTNFTLNGSVGNGNFTGTTNIAVGSNGATLPQATINVGSTTGFPTSGIIFVTTSTGVSTVSYTGTNATQFTGCTGGTGVMSTGGVVSSGVSNGCSRYLHLQNGIYLQWNGCAGLTP
jgi:hypothetical protein